MESRQKLRRVDSRIDVARALQLRLEKGLTYRELGRLFGVSAQAVHKALEPFRNLLEQPAAAAAYRKQETQILDGVRMALVSHMLEPEKLAKASVNNLAFAYQQVFNASRLLRDQSTANIGPKADSVIRAHEKRRNTPRNVPADESQT